MKLLLESDYIFCYYLLTCVFDCSAKNESVFHTCMMKISSHHRALYCYLLLSVWIFLLVAGWFS